MGALHIGIVYHSIFCNRPIPIPIAAVLQAASTPNLPGSETTVFSLSSNASTLYGFITLSDKQSISTLESESVAAAVVTLNNALAGRNRSASDVSRFRISSVQLRNHEVGYFDPLLWAVRVMICVEFFCIGGKCSVVLCLKNRKSGGVSSLIPLGLHVSRIIMITLIKGCSPERDRHCNAGRHNTFIMITFHN